MNQFTRREETANMRPLALVLLLIGISTTAHAAVTARFMPSYLPPVAKGSQETVAVVLRTDQATNKTNVKLVVPDGVTVTPASHTVKLEPGRDLPVFFKLKFGAVVGMGSPISVVADGRKLTVLGVGACYDLEAVSWKARFDKEGVGVKEGWYKPEFDDSSWDKRSLPSRWEDVGHTYLRARLYIPEEWRGRNLTLKIRAVDDNDVCYLNGVEIGRTNGWDTQRSYRVDPSVVKYGEENLLCLMVDNGNYGGGIYKSPSLFGVVIIDENLPAPVKLAPPGPLGKPLPFRKMRVENGVLLYEDGGEVALIGVNYYPQSWYQFDNMKRLGVDMKKAIRDDLDDMKRMGVEVIRVHVFDREISDRNGNILDNEHLDLLDYLVAESAKRGIYFFFTPIAWWWGPNQNDESFSALTPKEFMFCDDTAIKAQANYLKNFLNRKNRYTGHAYKDEPSICVFELMNEPAYVDYNGLHDPNQWYYRTDSEKMAPFKERLMRKWQTWCVSHGIGNDHRFFPLFRYKLMQDYLDTLYGAVRSTDARQPVACALFDAHGSDDLIRAIADSPCEAVTTGDYAGSFDKVGDGVNYLPWTVNRAIDNRLKSKARFVYEFDGSKTFGSYLYPAFARRWRNAGVQVCCMFQYDSSTTAEWNTDWDAHYLNWFYTPSKAVSFEIATRVFHDLNRGCVFNTSGASQFFGACAVSFDRDISIYSDAKTYINSTPYKSWRPTRVPERPEFVMSVGDSPYARYSGSGIYKLTVNYAEQKAELVVNPDAEVVGDPWHPSAAKSAVVLRREKHPFTLKLRDIELKRVVADDGEEVTVRDNTFEVVPGSYVLQW